MPWILRRYETESDRCLNQFGNGISLSGRAIISYASHSFKQTGMFKNAPL